MIAAIPWKPTPSRNDEQEESSGLYYKTETSYRAS